MKLKHRAKIAVCIPLTWDFTGHKDFWFDCIRMMMKAQKSNRYELIFHYETGCYMDQCRDRLAEKAMKCEPHYLLWLDADQLYPDDTPDRLLTHLRQDKKKLIVGGATPKRDNGFPLMYEFINPDGVFKCRYIWKPLNQGLVKVDAMGMGGIMTDVKLFDIIPKPRFKMWWSDASDSYVGEDIQFYKLCREHNIDVWCDTDLHYGHLAIKPVVFNTKFNRKEEVDNGGKSNCIR